MLATAFLFCSTEASGFSNSSEIPASDDAIVLAEVISAQSSSLQIVSLIPLLYNGNVHVRCHGQNSGRATVEVTGGVLPYTYTWSSGYPIMGGTMAVGLYAGNVSVTVTDAVGNSVSQSTTLTQNPPLQAIANVTPILCHGGVATINVNGTGGTSPLNGLNWYQFAAGTYSFTVADANGCRDEVTTTIIEPPVLEATSVVTAPILCNGDVTSVLVEASGGTGNYNGVGTYNEYAGNAWYSITDANGCYAYTSVAINQPPVFAAAVTSSEIGCRGGNSEVNVSGIGGVTPYTGGMGTFSQVAGNYNYVIYDANGCQATSSITITQPTALIATISNTSIACSGDLSSIEVEASGGTAPYIGPGLFFEPAGLHQYTVQDANGCWVDISTNVLEPREIQLDVSWTPITGNGTTDVLVDAGGGTPAYIGTGLYAAGPGVHVYTVYDANGCSGSETISIATPITNPQNSNVVVFEQNNDQKSGNSIDVASLVQGSFNTSNEHIEISYELNYDSRVSIEIYDMSGALVESIKGDNISLEGESNLVSIDSEELRTGVYLYHFVTDSERQVGKLQIVQ